MAKWMQNPAISGDAGKVLMGDQKAALYLALNSGWAETTAPIGGVTPPPDSALDLEQVRDVIALALRGLGGITIEPDDPGDTIGIRQKNKLADLADVDQGGAAAGGVYALRRKSDGTNELVSVPFPYSAQASSTTLVAGRWHGYDTTAAARTATFPAADAAAVAANVQVAVSWDGGTNPLNLATQGSDQIVTAAGLVATGVVPAANELILYQAVAVNRWRAVGGFKSVAALQAVFDGRYPQLTRAVSTAYAATVTPNVDTTDVLNIGALTGNLTLANPTGTPRDGQNLRVRLVQDATGGRTVTLGTAYAAGTDVTVAMIPTTANAKCELLFTWNASDSKWRFMSLVRGF